MIVRKTLAFALVIGIAAPLLGPALAAHEGRPRYWNDPYLVRDPHPVGSVKRLVPGLLGAIAGTYFGGSFGMIGRIVGGVVGWYAGNVIGRHLFPGHYYDDLGHHRWYWQHSRPHLGWGGAYPYANDPFPLYGGSAWAMPRVVPAYGPRAPQPSDERVAALRDAFYKALAAYQEVLKTGTDARKQEARAAYEAAYKAYQDAKKSALGQ